MGRTGCAVPNCQPSKDDARHRFPNPRTAYKSRFFQLWLRKINNAALKDLDQAVIYRKYRVCDKHFVARHHATNNRLCNKAYPRLHLPSNEEVNNQHLRNTRPPNSAPNKRKLENELLITSSRKQMRTLGSFNQNTCIDLDTSKSMKMFKLVPVDAVIDSRVPDLLREPQIEIVYLPTTKEDESDVQSENLASLSEETFPEETCPDVSCERDSILPHDLPPPQNYDPSCDFVPKQMYMELKFNYMDVLSRIRKLEKNARESDEERKELRTENYRLIYELKKLKNSYNLQSKKLSEEAEKCNANVFVVTGNKVTLKKNILSDW